MLLLPLCLELVKTIMILDLCEIGDRRQTVDEQLAQPQPSQVNSLQAKIGTKICQSSRTFPFVDDSYSKLVKLHEAAEKILDLLLGR